MKQMIKRLAIRTLAFFVLTIVAFAMMRPLTMETGHTDVLKCMTAAAVLAWAEISIMWIRIAMAPKLDEQQAASDVHKLHDATALAVVYGVHAYKWSIRLFAFIFLYQGVL